MAYGAIFDVPAPVEAYDQLLPLVNEVTGGLAPGCLVHVVTPTDSGYRVIEVWRSQQDWQRFQSEVVGPLLQRVTGQSDPPQPVPQPFPVHAVRTAPV